MPQRALYERRPWLVGSIVAAAAFYYLREAEMPEVAVLAIKGSAVAMLAAYAWLRHSSPDARLLVYVMGFSALGDMAIQLDQQIGGVLFFASHIVALMLYLRNRRDRLTPSQKAAAAALLLLTPIIAYSLPADRSIAPQVALYGLTVGAMAATAWASSFPRYRVGAGALLFVVSDVLIFAEMGPLAGSNIPYVLIWPTYYLGQFLICTGIIQTLRKREPELRAVR